MRIRRAGRRGFLPAAALGGGAIILAMIASVEAQDSANLFSMSCSTQLTMHDNVVEYTCGSNGTQQKTMVADFQVDLEASEVTLVLQDGQVIQTLNITGTTDQPSLNYSDATLSMTGFSVMHSLRFEKVAFKRDLVELALPNTLTDLHIVNSKLSDLSLSTYEASLTVLDFTGTYFDQIPKVLYERVYNTNVDIVVNMSLVTGSTTLSSTNLMNLKSNVLSEFDENCLDVNGVVSCGLPSTLTSKVVKSDPSDPAANHPSSGSWTGTNDDDSSSSGVSTGVLVVIIVIVVVIALVLAFFLLRMHMKRKSTSANANNNEATATLMSKVDAPDKGSFISSDEFLRNLRLPQSDVTLIKSVGTGRLWLGEYNGNRVMVKRVESEVTDSYVTKALIAQARTFATISHRNITNLIGVTWLAGTDFAVVTELMDKGNLKAVLSNVKLDLSIASKLQMCCDIALALAYLHETEQNLCAKQLSSRKVLVNDALTCKLSLFECVPSSTKLNGPNTSTPYSYGMGEAAWFPPEVITRSSPMDGRKCNIFAFGVLVCEIFTRVSPYQMKIEEKGNTMSDVELVKHVWCQDVLLPHENRREFLDAPASVRQMVEQCLSYAPMSRPTAKRLVEILQSAKEELTDSNI